MSKFRILNKVILAAPLLPVLSHDDVSPTSETAKNAERDNIQETGWDRVVRMFSTDEHDSFSPELQSIIQVGCMSTFSGAIYGGFLSSRTAYMDFVKNNQASVFRDHFEAKKKLQDKVTLSFGKGAFRWGWRLTLFSTTYMTVSTSISVYRGKFGIIEHIAAGTVAGMTYKFPLGPRGWIVGGGLGSILGLVAGAFTYGILTLTGYSMEDVRYWQYQWKENRMDIKKEAIDKQRESDELIIMHNLKIGDVGKSLDNLVINENEKK